MDDHQLLEQLASAPSRPHPYAHHRRLHGVEHLERSALLACPPTNKQYRGHVGYRIDDGEVTFVGFTTYGRVDGDQSGQVRFSRSLDLVLDHVNRILDAKCRKGYRRVDGRDLHLQRAAVEARIAERLAR